MFDHDPKITSGNILLQGIINEKVKIKSTVIHFKQGDSHKLYISNIHVDFDGLICTDFFRAFS